MSGCTTVRPSRTNKGVRWMSIVTDPPPELAPSATATEPPTASRVIGLFGLFATVAGAVTLVAKGYDRGLLPEGVGYLLGLFGLLGMLVHAARDGDLEVRRLYGLLAGLLIAGGLIASLIPGGPNRVYGYHLLPWGAGAGLLGLLFLIPFARYETEAPYRRLVESVFLGIGSLLAVGSLLAGLIRPDFLVGPGLVLGLLGLGYLSAYLGQTDANTGRGFQVAVGVGLLGAIALAIGLGLSIGPTVLYEGPAALRSPLQTLDPWKVVARLVSVAIGVGLVIVALRRTTVPWLRGVFGVVGVAIVGLFVLGSVTTNLFGWTRPPAPFLVPYGLLYTALGLLYLGVALGTISDAQFVVLLRRELAAYFFSPIAYFVLFGTAVVAAIGYILFVGGLLQSPSVPEPIVQQYMSAEILAAFQVVFLVPVLTMRQFAEEKRTGTLEVLLTAPVDEPVIVLSKLVATWVFYLLCFLPLGLYLVALRSAGGVPFDYRPMLSYYLAVAACGVGFVAIGLFCSVVTPNQVVAAALTFAALMFLLLTVLAPRFGVLGEGLRTAIGRLDFYRLWANALGGQLPVQGVLVYLSLGVFWTFLTVKVLEARRWT